VSRVNIQGFPAYLLGGSPDEFEWEQNPKRVVVRKLAVVPLTRGARIKAEREKSFQQKKRTHERRENMPADYRARQARRVLKDAVAEVVRDEQAILDGQVS
jgi:hypothetical protein